LVAEPIFCFICEDTTATGLLLRYRDGRPLPREEGAAAMSVCKGCGDKVPKQDKFGASLRYTPFLRPPQPPQEHRRRR